jgi:hypothetical protein
VDVTETPYARPVIIAVVITVIGGLLLRGCARRMERRLAPSPRSARVDTTSGPPDSARAVALAFHAYVVDRTARGERAVAPRLTAFAADSAGFQIELAPSDARPGARAAVRVARTGQVELHRLGP